MCGPFARSCPARFVFDKTSRKHCKLQCFCLVPRKSSISKKQNVYSLLFWFFYFGFPGIQDFRAMFESGLEGNHID